MPGTQEIKPGEFNPLLALAGILQKMADKKTETATVAAAAATAEPCQLSEETEDITE